MFWISHFWFEYLLSREAAADHDERNNIGVSHKIVRFQDRKCLATVINQFDILEKSYLKKIETKHFGNGHSVYETLDQVLNT